MLKVHRGLINFSRYQSTVKHYNDIPSPKSWPLIGHAYLFAKTGKSYNIILYEKLCLTLIVLNF